MAPSSSNSSRQSSNSSRQSSNYSRHSSTASLMNTVLSTRAQSSTGSSNRVSPTIYLPSTQPHVNPSGSYQPSSVSANCGPALGAGYFGEGPITPWQSRWNSHNQNPKFPQSQTLQNTQPITPWQSRWNSHNDNHKFPQSQTLQNTQPITPWQSRWNSHNENPKFPQSQTLQNTRPITPWQSRWNSHNENPKFPQSQTLQNTRPITPWQSRWNSHNESPKFPQSQTLQNTRPITPWQSRWNSHNENPKFPQSQTLQNTRPITPWQSRWNSHNENPSPSHDSGYGLALSGHSSVSSNLGPAVSAGYARPTIPPIAYPPSPYGSSGSFSRPQSDDPTEVYKLNAINKLVETVHGDVVGMRKGREAEMEGMINAQVVLRQREEQLNKGVKEMQDEKEGLEQQLQMILMNTDVLEAWLRENEAKRRNLESVDVDAAFDCVDSLSKQMLECTASDLAIEDVIYALDKAVQEGAIPFDQYLRNVRLLSREQFFHCATATKVRGYQMQAQVANMASRISQFIS